MLLVSHIIFEKVKLIHVKNFNISESNIVMSHTENTMVLRSATK